MVENHWNAVYVTNFLKFAPEMKIGDTVSVLDDAFSGVVTAVDNGRVTIVTSDGFEFDFLEHELVVIDDAISLHDFIEMDVATVISEKESSDRKKIPTKKSKKRKEHVFEVDLHIHHLIPSTKGLSNFDILNIQMAEAQRQLDRAIANRWQTVVFIHGVGEGVLREELYTLFRRYENIDFFDAEYQKYGLGATEIYIYQNG